MGPASNALVVPTSRMRFGSYNMVGPLLSDFHGYNLTPQTSLSLSLPLCMPLTGDHLSHQAQALSEEAQNEYAIMMMMIS